MSPVVEISFSVRTGIMWNYEDSSEFTLLLIEN